MPHDASQRPCGSAGVKPAFTLVELLVVIGIIAVLVGVLMPALARGRDAARSVRCASNVRQLYAAAVLYANDNRGFCPPAHLHFVTKNLHRWCGTRQAVSQAFDFTDSPLHRYLGGGQVRRCEVLEAVESPDAFEQSSGGYGYNAAFIGSSTGLATPGGVLGLAQYEAQVVNVPAKLALIRKPAETVVFADTAIANPHLIEYSFAEPPLTSWGENTSPSIHFRHRARANVCWADGHISSEELSWSVDRNVYGVENRKFQLGFFGPRDNSLFDRD